MPKFETVDYEQMLVQFQDAETLGIRMKQGDLETSEWLQQEKINQDDVIEASKNFPDSRIFIIASGRFKGFYVYSKNTQSCIKVNSGEI